MNLSYILHAVARAVPNRPAITAYNGHLTYNEMDKQVSSIAGALLRHYNLKPGDRVGLAMTNCAEFFTCLFGAWRAGLTAVPINAKLHARETSWILENCTAKLCIMTPDIAASVSEAADAFWPEIIATESADYDALLKSDEVPIRPGNPQDPAWLFYTSGTTGRPKGAVLSHRNLLFMTHAYYADIDSIGPRDTMVHAAPLSHGAGLYGLAHVLKGANNVIYKSFETGQILESFRTYDNVTMFAAPTMVTRLLNDPACGDCDTSGLRTIAYGGAPMYVADLKAGLEKLGQHFYQLYGQGESPMTISGLDQYLHADTDNPRYEERLASVGIARTGVAFRIAGPDGQTLPPGEIGEIITKSDCVMTGYWNNPEANAVALRDGWLWTGDMGALDEDGFLTLKDRSKDMIISGGTNIYPREIEEVLLTHVGVLECAVIGAPHADWGEEVVAFIVKQESGDALGEQELDQLCLDNIARFKRPKRYAFVDSLPKNNYGKILKTELRDWDKTGTES
ncbi:MAG: AMP-binding protein [Hyphomicrobiaceae bacterium]